MPLAQSTIDVVTVKTGPNSFVQFELTSNTLGDFMSHRESVYACAEQCGASCKSFDVCEAAACTTYTSSTPQRQGGECAYYEQFINDNCGHKAAKNPKGLRVNDGQIIGSHNSYRKANPSVPSWNIDMPSIKKQLNLGVRGFELDLHYNKNTKKLNVFHVLGVDEATNHRSLKEYFLQIRKWSDFNIGHFPIFVQLEIMSAFKVPTGDDIKVGGCAMGDVTGVLTCFVEKCEGKKFSAAEGCLTNQCMVQVMSVPNQCLSVAGCVREAINRADPNSRVTSSSAYATVDECTVATGNAPVKAPLTQEDAEKIKSILSSMLDSIITPSRLLTPNDLSGGVWPKVDEARGKVIVALMRGWEPQSPAHYFTNLTQTKKIDDPVEGATSIEASNKMGTLVRTRADDVYGKSISYAQRTKAVSSGAHVLSSDYLPPPRGERSGKNPLSAPVVGFWTPNGQPVSCNPFAISGCKSFHLESINTLHTCLTEAPTSMPTEMPTTKNPTKSPFGPPTHPPTEVRRTLRPTIKEQMNESAPTFPYTFFTAVVCTLQLTMMLQMRFY